MYYAHRFGVQPLIVDGEVVTKPEYLIMPSSFGFWIMFMLLYLFNIKSGCDFFNYLQRVFFRNSKVQVEMRPMTRHTSLVTFMELNLILWTNYMVLLFCYDDNFIGDRHPITALVAFGCLVGSLFMFRRLINISQWGYALRFFYCYSSRILDFRRSYGKMECLPRNLGGTNDIPIRNDYHFPCIYRASHLFMV